jgi:maleate isomerase
LGIGQGASSAPATVQLATRLDDGAIATRIGVIVFDEDVTTEADLARLGGGDDDVAIHVARMPLPLDPSPAGLARTADDIAAAAARLVPSARLDAIGYSCTTGTLQMGYAAVAEAVGRGRPGVPVATPITGAVKAFAALGVRRISLLTPYGPPLNSLIVEHLAGQGVQTLNIAAFDVPDEVDYARVSLASLRTGAASAMHARAEALFISCTALRGTGLIGELETALGRPVVTSTQALWWESLQLAGRPARMDDAGRLFTL